MRNVDGREGNADVGWPDLDTRESGRRSGQLTFTKKLQNDCGKARAAGWQAVAGPGIDWQRERGQPVHQAQLSMIQPVNEAQGGQSMRRGREPAVPTVVQPS